MPESCSHSLGAWFRILTRESSSQGLTGPATPPSPENYCPTRQKSPSSSMPTSSPPALTLKPERAAIRAGRMMLQMIDARVGRGESFAFETTLSGRSYARMIPRWQEQGYWVTIVFLRMSSPDAPIARVRQRALEGGHGVPEEFIRRRFHASWRNFEHIFRGLANEAIIYDV